MSPDRITDLAGLRQAAETALAACTGPSLWRTVAEGALAACDEAARLRAENTAQGVLGEIAAEQTAQFAKFGEQNHPDGTGYWPRAMEAEQARDDCQTAAKHGYLDWRLILREEVAEAFAEKDPVALRAELVQVAAVAATWIEALDRRALESGDLQDRWDAATTPPPALGLDQDGEGQANG